MDSHTKHRRQENSAFRENKNVSKKKCTPYYICKPAVKKKEKVPYLNSIKRLSFTNLSLSISAPFSSYIKCFVVLLYLHSHDKISCGTVKVDFHHRALNFHVCAWPFIHCLLFIYTRKFYVCSHGKITRQWKSTLTLDCQLLLGKMSLLSSPHLSLGRIKVRA